MRYTDEQLAEIKQRTTADVNDNAAVVLPLIEDLTEAREQLAEVKNALMVSETYRREYATGKYKLYAMEERIREAAAAHLPWGSEGPLDRYVAKVESEHSPLLVKNNRQLVGLLKTAENKLKPYAWRPIAEIHEDHGNCVLINLDDPGCLELGHVCGSDFDTSRWTHFTEVPKLTTEDAKRLLADMTEEQTDV